MADLSILDPAHLADCRKRHPDFILGCLYEADRIGDDARCDAYCALLDERNAEIRAEIAAMKEAS